jgi:hypothetical protein
MADALQVEPRIAENPRLQIRVCQYHELGNRDRCSQWTWRTGDGRKLDLSMAVRFWGLRYGESRCDRLRYRVRTLSVTSRATRTAKSWPYAIRTLRHWR